MITKQMALRFTHILVIFLLLILTTLVFIHYLFPLFLACVFSLLLLPFIRSIHRNFGIPYLLSCFICICLVIVGALVFLSLLGLKIINGVVYLANWMPSRLQFLIQKISDLVDQLLQPIINKSNHFFENLPSEKHLLLEEPLEEVSQNVKAYIVSLLEDIIFWLSDSLASLPGSFTVLMFTLLCTFFICKDWERIKYLILRLFPVSILDITSNIHQQLKEKVMKYLFAQLQLISITFVLIFISFLVLQIEHALTIAIIIALVDLLPILGTGFIFLPWTLYLFITNDYTLGLILFILYLFIVTVRQILEPKFIANAIGIHPLFTIMTIYLGYQLFDLKGIWLGPTILFIIKASIDAKVFHLLFAYIKYNRFNVDKW